MNRYDPILDPIDAVNCEMRGEAIAPPPLGQILSRSKYGQAKILGAMMVPGTFPVANRSQLMDALNYFRSRSITNVVTKDDRGSGGYGIRFWSDPEMVYSCYEQLPDRFVIQPRVTEFTDLRVVMAGGKAIDSYRRKNPINPRQNLTQGGRATPVSLHPAMERVCRDAMYQGGFVHACVDLLVTASSTYLSEISVSGGLSGSKLRGDERNRLFAKARNEYRQLRKALSTQEALGSILHGHGKVFDMSDAQK